MSPSITHSSKSESAAPEKLDLSAAVSGGWLRPEINPLLEILSMFHLNNSHMMKEHLAGSQMQGSAAWKYQALPLPA